MVQELITHFSDNLAFLLRAPGLRVQVPGMLPTQRARGIWTVRRTMGDLGVAI